MKKYKLGEKLTVTKGCPEVKVKNRPLAECRYPVCGKFSKRLPMTSTGSELTQQAWGKGELKACWWLLEGTMWGHLDLGTLQCRPGEQSLALLTVAVSFGL